MKKVDFQEIHEAAKLFCLDDTATEADIKKTYHELARKYHPDKCTGRRKKKCEEIFKKISTTYKVLMAYCKTHGTSFKDKDIKQNIMGKEYYDHLRRFYDGWWGNLDLE